MTGVTGEREAFARASRRPTHAPPAPAHKSFADRTSLYQEITDKIIASSNRAACPGCSRGYRAGAAAPLGLPKNAATGRAYSGINILILWCACTERGFTGQNWLTFRQALKIGAHVRKGERGTTVVYADRFIPYRERTRAAETGDEPEAIPFLKRFTVFNADQCEDLPAEIAPPPEPLGRKPDPAAGRGADPRDRRRYPHRRQPRLLCSERRLHPGAAALGFLRADQFSPDGLS